MSPAPCPRSLRLPGASAFNSAAGADGTIGSATSRCRDAIATPRRLQLRGGRCPDSDRQARSPARSLRPSGRPLTSRFLRHVRDLAARAGETIAFPRPRHQRCQIAMANGARVREQAALGADLSAATIGSSGAFSERAIAALVRLRGKRRVGWCAGDRSLIHLVLEELAHPRPYWETVRARSPADAPGGTGTTARRLRGRPASHVGPEPNLHASVAEVEDGRGISGYRCWYTLTVLRYARRSGSATPLASMSSSMSTHWSMRSSGSSFKFVASGRFPACGLEVLADKFGEDGGWRWVSSSRSRCH